MNLDYRRAALLSCHHAAWQSRENRPPAVLPREIRPLHQEVAAGMFSGATAREDLRARSDAMAILGTAPKIDHAALLPAQKQAALPAALLNGARCPCCCARAAHDQLSELPAHPKILTHDPPTIDFDADRMTTEVTTTVKAEVSRDEASRLLSNADPRNWKQAAPDFFLLSDPGVYQDGKWTPRPWDRPDGGLLREQVHWNWNGVNPVAFDNILSIDGLEKSEWSISYDYALYTSLQSRLLVVWDGGGLDVDEGYYAASYDPESQTLNMTASKCVRFTAPGNGPFEIALALNLMAPATISMLMQKLVNVSPQDGQE
jgi:hypothetical protein